MKNKILLLFVLLIPSLCFGESIKIEYRSIRDTKHPFLNEEKIYFTSSIDMTEMLRGGKTITKENRIEFLFSANSYVIEQSKNKLEFGILNVILEKLTNSNDFVKTNEYFTIDPTMYSILMYIERVLIKNGYTVTFIEKREKGEFEGPYDNSYTYYFLK